MFTRRIARLFIPAQLAFLLLTAACGGNVPAPTPTGLPATATAVAVVLPTATPLDTPTSTELEPPGTVEGELSQAPPITPMPTPAGLTEGDRLGIYSQVVATLLQGEGAQHVYISPYVGEGAGLDSPNQDLPISDSLISGLKSGGDQRTYQLLDFSQAVGSLDEGGKVNNGGVFITLGLITEDPTNPAGVLVQGSIYRQVGDADGYSFHFEPDASAPGAWKLAASSRDWGGSG